ncbi:uncharacterized protein LOC129587271 [Paramacrobiotus metropolitanus]|uniref:uncharacterized protein LOC129587271 n=1 Tax=Paramacrobiotus metropolitanus TaxID=2943436 RepID=UPI0024458DC4|nr:uncharacterized protein LOC129587271 [Paramacrobiotus metropolitanus]
MAEETADENGMEEEEAEDRLEEQDVEDPDALEMSPTKEAKYQQVVYGTKVDYISGYDVDGYEAVSRGVSRTIPTQCLATLLFRAAKGAVPHILFAVPQRIMCNCLFVIDLKKLPRETDLYFDGLGTWDQNCGKITSYFRYVNGEAVDAKGEKDAVMFLRRTDRNTNCKAYTRVVVICKDFGLAAVQYYFKNAEEQSFEITNANQRGVRVSAMYTTTRGMKRRADEELDEDGKSNPPADEPDTGNHSIVSLPKEDAPRRTRSGIVHYASQTSDINVPAHSTRSASKRASSVNRTLLYGNSNLSADIPDTLTPSALLAYLKTHVTIDRQERAEDRVLRRAELEARKQERVDEMRIRREEMESLRKEKHEEIEMRKQELSLEKAKLQLEQQRWELDRKEKEMFLELLKKKLLD